MTKKVTNLQPKQTVAENTAMKSYLLVSNFYTLGNWYKKSSIYSHSLFDANKISFAIPKFLILPA